MSENVDYILAIEHQVENHAILCTAGFLILLPVGVLIARFARTFTPHWFPIHAALQLVVTAPIIIVGWYYGWATSEALGQGHFVDTHQRIGLTLLVLYMLQVLLGVFTHWVKIPKSGGPFGPGTRRIQNYVHVVLGLIIFVLAAAQMYYGLYIELDYAFGDFLAGDPATQAELAGVLMVSKRVWIGAVVAFWALYLIGMALIPRQLRQEKESLAKATNEFGMTSKDIDW